MRIESGDGAVLMRLIERYNRSTPRYTSYPPVPHWEPAEADILFEALGKSACPLSVYVHIPFCEQLCLYCGCNVVITRNHSVVPGYLERLIAEMDLLDAAHHRRVNQIHWGGGTPTYLDCRQIEALFNAIVSRFFVPDGAEISVEIDPRRTTPEQLGTLRSLGFNRLSMGVQDFDPAVQQAVRRIQPYPVTRDLILHARSLGFESINLDLMYGLPLQTKNSFAATLEQVLELAPGRITVFSYAHVPALKRQQRGIEKNLPTGREKLDLFLMAIERLTQGGYEHIGMDHFARPGDPLAVAHATGSLHRNFQGYTTHAETDLVGFGVSAISRVGNTYTQNHRELSLYNEAIDRGRLPIFRGHLLSAEDSLRGAVIESLLSNNSLHKDEIEAAFGIQFDTHFSRELKQLAVFEHDGLIDGLPGRQLRVTNIGRVFVRTIAQVFDAFQSAPIASAAV